MVNYIYIACIGKWTPLPRDQYSSQAEGGGGVGKRRGIYTDLRIHDNKSYHTKRRRGRIQLMKDLNYSAVVCDAYISISSQLRMEEIVWSVRSRKSLITISTKIQTLTRLSRLLVFPYLLVRY